MPIPSSIDTGQSVSVPAYRGRLFRKYLLLILTLVSGALLVSGAMSVYFSYQENKSALASLQQEKAVAAASRIEQYIHQIEQQLAFASLPQLDAGDVEVRRIEFLKLLRQAPEVTDVAQIDAGRPRADRRLAPRDGRRRIGRDRSQEPAFRNARRGQTWYGPVYFRKETEPYMTIAIRAAATAGRSPSPTSISSSSGTWSRGSGSATRARPTSSTAAATSSPTRTSGWCCARPTCRSSRT